MMLMLMFWKNVKRWATNCLNRKNNREKERGHTSFSVGFLQPVTVYYLHPLVNPAWTERQISSRLINWFCRVILLLINNQQFNWGGGEMEQLPGLY